VNDSDKKATKLTIAYPLNTLVMNSDEKTEKSIAGGEWPYAWCMPLLIIGEVHRIKLQKAILKFIFTLFLQQYQNWENKIQQCLLNTLVMNNDEKTEKSIAGGEWPYAWCMPLLTIGKVYRIKLRKAILKFIFTLFLQQYQNWENKIQQCQLKFTLSNFPLKNEWRPSRNQDHHSK